MRRGNERGDCQCKMVCLKHKTVRNSQTLDWVRTLSKQNRLYNKFFINFVIKSWKYKANFFVLNVKQKLLSLQNKITLTLSCVKKMPKMNFSQFVFITIGLISVNVQSTHIEPRHHHNNNNSNNNNIHQHQLDTLASKLIASMGIDKLPNYTNVSTNIIVLFVLRKNIFLHCKLVRLCKRRNSWSIEDESEGLLLVFM